jgi:hypothetical protein
LPISDLATGAANEIEPAFGSASSSPIPSAECHGAPKRNNIR